MENLYRHMLTNMTETKEILKGFDGNMIDFSFYVNEDEDDENVMDGLEAYPQILMEDKFGYFCYMTVTKVVLDDKDNIMFFVRETEEWVLSHNAESLTADEVFKAVGIVARMS